MKFSMKLVIVACLFSALHLHAAPPNAQDAVFRQQLRDLHKQYQAVFLKVEKMAGPLTQQQLDTNQAAWAVNKLLFALSGDVEQEDLNRQRRGADSDRNLALIAHASGSMSFGIQTIRRYSETGDRLFLNAAKDIDRIVTAAINAL